MKRKISFIINLIKKVSCYHQCICPVCLKSETRVTVVACAHQIRMRAVSADLFQSRASPNTPDYGRTHPNLIVEFSLRVRWVTTLKMVEYFYAALYWNWWYSFLGWTFFRSTKHLFELFSCPKRKILQSLSVENPLQKRQCS